MAINPMKLMKLGGLAKRFQANHPRVAAFLKTVLFTSGIPEGTIIELRVTRPGEEMSVTNMKVTADDIALFEEAKDLMH